MKPPNVTMEELAVRCEALAGPDREVDFLILCIADPRAVKTGPLPGDPKYTASLDAAMSLIPDGWRWWKAGDGRTGGSRMVLVDAEDENGRWSVFGECPCPETSERNAAALCSAALRARALTPRTDGGGDNDAR